MQSPQEQHQQQTEQRSVWQEHRALTGSPSTATGSNAAATTATAFLRTVTRSYFGPIHAFRIYSNPVVVVGGYPALPVRRRYYFSVVDPWPQYWSNDWYANDDVYVDYNGDGYYLYNRRYPRDRISISVNVGGWAEWWMAEAHGSSIVHTTGSLSTATGSNAAATTATGFPRTRYRGYFGPDHGFRMSSYPVAVVGGYPRFQYGGYSFSVVDPWPEYWSDNWYDNDDVYIDYSGDGYYLYNRRYPQDRIAFNVYAN